MYYFTCVESLALFSNEVRDIRDRYHEAFFNFFDADSVTLHGVGVAGAIIEKDPGLATKRGPTKAAAHLRSKRGPVLCIVPGGDVAGWIREIEALFGKDGCRQVGVYVRFPCLG